MAKDQSSEAVTTVAKGVPNLCDQALCVPVMVTTRLLPPTRIQVQRASHTLPPSSRMGSTCMNRKHQVQYKAQVPTKKELHPLSCPTPLVFTQGRCRDIRHDITLGKLATVDPDTATVKLYDTHTWRQLSRVRCCASLHVSVCVCAGYMLACSQIPTCPVADAQMHASSCRSTKVPH